jgi:hypothetical protein
MKRVGESVAVGNAVTKVAKEVARELASTGRIEFRRSDWDFESICDLLVADKRQ